MGMNEDAANRICFGINHDNQVVESIATHYPNNPVPNLTFLRNYGSWDTFTRWLEVANWFHDKYMAQFDVPQVYKNAFDDNNK